MHGQSSITHVAAAPEGPWYRAITSEQWRVLLAAKFGWMLDAMDFMLYAMAVGQLRAYFGFDDGTAGILGTATLVMSGIGGLTFGYVADRFGRTRALMATIAIFSLASLGAATSMTVVQLLLWRALLGLGMGGEWASGAVLVSETWPAAHRNKAISIMQSGWAIGYIVAALLAALILDLPSLGNNAWRVLFVVGVLPAAFTLWIRRNVREPETWTVRQAARDTAPNPFGVIFGKKMIGRTVRIIMLGAATQFAYWGVFFWLPSFLARPIDQGGAGMGVVNSFGWILAVQVGAYLGYLSFGFIADQLGRRNTFILFMVAAATLVPIYGQMARNPLALLLLGPVLGYFGSGHFSMFGGFVAELFPTAVRATGQGTSYNIGRMAGAIAPYTIGALATLPGIGIGLALSLTSAFFLLAAILTFTLPDRSGQALEA
ncbi:MAG TPA: MFS transporter [Vicinamibacterales bacterium]|nr:MFS transporter [Vicinamibacterales bacterium]